MPDDKTLPTLIPMDVNAPVAITLPAYVWIGAVAAYMAAPEFNSWDIGVICRAIQEAMFGAAYVKGWEATQAERAEADPLSVILGGIQRVTQHFPMPPPPEETDFT